MVDAPPPPAGVDDAPEPVSMTTDGEVVEPRLGFGPVTGDMELFEFHRGLLVLSDGTTVMVAVLEVPVFGDMMTDVVGLTVVVGVTVVVGLTVVITTMT